MNSKRCSFRCVRWMHLSKHELCTRKMKLTLDEKFYLDFHRVTRPWRRTTLTNGSDAKYVFPRCLGLTGSRLSILISEEPQLVCFSLPFPRFPVVAESLLSVATEQSLEFSLYFSPVEEVRHGVDCWIQEYQYDGHVMRNWWNRCIGKEKDRESRVW